MMKLPKIGGGKSSENGPASPRRGTNSPPTSNDSTKKQKQRFVRRVGKKEAEVIGTETDLPADATKLNATNDAAEEDLDHLSDRNTSEWDMLDASAALDRLQMSEQQRKQLEIATHLEMIQQRIKHALESCGMNPDLNAVDVEPNRPPVYDAQGSTKDKQQNEVDNLIHLLDKQETNKNAIIREVDDFLGIASLDENLSEEPLNKAFHIVEVEERTAKKGLGEVDEAYRYTGELTNRMKVCWFHAMKEAGFVDDSSEEDEDDELFDTRGKGGKGTKEMKMFSNQGAFGNNTNMIGKSLEEIMRMVKGRSKKEQVKQLLKQYKAQVKVTEQWLQELKKREEENTSLSQAVKELKKSRDQANKTKEELDLKKRHYERKANELDSENQRLKVTNESLTTKNRKLESEVTRLQDKLDTVEDEAVMAREFGSSRFEEAKATVPKGGMDEATKQVVQNLQADIANLHKVIEANNAKMTALEKELIAERGIVSRLKHELSLASRTGPASPANVKEKEKGKTKSTASEPPKTAETNKTDESKISQIKDDYEKAKFQIKELKVELQRKTEEVENLEKQTTDLRKELMSVFDDGGDQEVPAPTLPASSQDSTKPPQLLNTQQEERDAQEAELFPDISATDPTESTLPESTKTQIPMIPAGGSQKMVPASQLAYLRRVMRAMTIDHQAEMKKLMTHLENEKSRTEASVRKLEQAHKEQLLNVHRQAVQVLRMINRFRTAIAGILEKEMVMKAADNVRKIADLNTDEAPADTKEMLNIMATQVSAVFMGMENYITQAFLSIRLENKEKISANQVVQQNLKNAALQASKQQKGVEYMTEQLRQVNDELQTVKDNYMAFKKQEEVKYQSLYHRYMKLYTKYSVTQKDIDQFQRDFVEALCMKERELDDTRIAHRDCQRLYDEQKKLATQLQHKINSKLEYWDEHVCLSAQNMRENMKILHKALKESKISLMVHNMTVDMIKLIMDIPVLRLRSIFKRYVRMRNFQAAKEEMEHELKGLPDDAEHKDIVHEYMKYLSRMDMRLDRRAKLWQTEIDKLEDMRRSGWKEFVDVWDGHFKGTDFASLTEEDLFMFAIGRGRGDLLTPSPVPPAGKRQKDQGLETQSRYDLKGLRLPRLEDNTKLIGQRVPLIGERPDMWRVRSSRVKKRVGEDDEEFRESITTPKTTELENNQHMRSAYKSFGRQPSTKRLILSLQPAEPYDFQQAVPRPISKAFHDSTFRMDPDVDMFTLTDGSSMNATTPHNTEMTVKSFTDSDSQRMEVKIPKYNVGTHLY